MLPKRVFVALVSRKYPKVYFSDEGENDCRRKKGNCYLCIVVSDSSLWLKKLIFCLL